MTTQHVLSSRLLLAAQLFLFSIACCLPPALAQATSRRFDIPADTAERSLKMLAEQSGREVLFPPGLVTGVRTAAVRGEMMAEDALHRMLAGTPLVAVSSGRTGALTVRRAASATAEQPVEQKKSPTVAASDPNAPLVLSPFEVSSDQDYGYTATNTLAGGRLNTALRDTPASISVLTREFLDDIGGGDFRTALQYATNAIPVSDTDTPIDAGIGNTSAGEPQAEASPTAVRVRGFAESRATRNYFVWNINSDTYNTERIDIARGPNTLIFGDAGSGGVANLTTKQARFDPFEKVSVRYSSYGGARGTLDVNRPITDSIAVRLNAIVAREHGWRDIETYSRDGAYGTATWRISPRTQLRADFEWGHLENNVPQTVTRDNISAWNGTFVINSRNQAIPNTAGVARFAPAGYLVYTSGQEQLGFVDWGGFGRTNGNGFALETRPSPVAPEDAVPLLFTADAVATLGRRHFGVLPHRGFSVTPHNQKFETDFGAGSVTFNHQFGDNLFLEAGYAHQEDYRKRNITGQTNAVFLDINAVLPTGGPNPNFLRPFMDFINNRDSHTTAEYDELRVSLAYQLKTRLTDQKVGFFGSTRRNRSSQRLFRPRWVNNPANPNVDAAVNRPIFRTYLDRRNDPVPYTTLSGNFGGREIAIVEVGGGSRDEITNETAQVFASGSWFQSRRLKTLMGLRRDVSDSETWNPVLDPVTGLQTSLTPGSSRSVAQTSPTIGAVYDVLPWLSVYANYSESFLAASGGQIKLDGSIIEPRRGEGRELGLKFELLSGRISGSATYYEQEEKNNLFRVLSNNNTDVVGAGVAGVGVHLNAIADALDQPIFSGGRNTIPNYIDVRDVYATGFEFDVTANLTRGWSLLANFALPEIEQQNTLADTRAFVSANRAAWTAAATAAGPAVAATVAERLDTIDQQIAQFPDGRKSNGLVTYSANLFTRYRFTEGRFKGLFVGGGVNLRGKRVAGIAPDGTVLYASGYPVLNALAGYSTRLGGSTVNFQLNVTNLLDEEYQRYTAYVFRNGRLEPFVFTHQAPRRLMLTATVGF